MCVCRTGAQYGVEYCVHVTASAGQHPNVPPTLLYRGVPSSCLACPVRRGAGAAFKKCETLEESLLWDCGIAWWQTVISIQHVGWQAGSYRTFPFSCPGARYEPALMLFRGRWKTRWKQSASFSGCKSRLEGWTCTAGQSMGECQEQIMVS